MGGFFKKQNKKYSWNYTRADRNFQNATSEKILPQYVIITLHPRHGLLVDTCHSEAGPWPTSIWRPPRPILAWLMLCGRLENNHPSKKSFYAWWRAQFGRWFSSHPQISSSLSPKNWNKKNHINSNEFKWVSSWNGQVVISRKKYLLYIFCKKKHLGIGN